MPRYKNNSWPNMAPHREWLRNTRKYQTWKWLHASTNQKRFQCWREHPLQLKSRKIELVNHSVRKHQIKYTRKVPTGCVKISSKNTPDRVYINWKQSGVNVALKQNKINPSCKQLRLLFCFVIAFKNIWLFHWKFL